MEPQGFKQTLASNLFVCLFVWSVPVFSPVTMVFCLIYQEKRKWTFPLVLRNVHNKKVRTSYLKVAQDLKQMAVY